MEFAIANPLINIPNHQYDLNDLVSRLDRSLLQSIEKIYRRKPEGLDLIEFTRFFMNCLDHSPEQAPLLAAGLSQLFEIIVQGKPRASFSDITDYVCNKILEREGTQKELSRRWLPVRGHQSNNPTYLQNPPVIRGGQTEQVSKVWAQTCTSDKQKHDNIISHAFYSQSSHKVYCLEGLADWIGIRSKQSKLQKKLRPSAFKVKKDAAVLSIAFSDREQRLGAVLKDFSLSFWDESDNHAFQKSISTAKQCQQLQTSIWYLQYFQKWVTADMSGVIYFWNLLTEKPQKIIQCKNRLKISDLCEIPSIGTLAVAQEQRGVHTQPTKIQLINIKRGEIVCEIDTKIQRRMLHTLRYSQEYQILLAAGYQKKIYLFQINQQYLDCSLRAELLGHESAVTCFTLVKHTPMIASADDRGKVKIWNIRNFKCMQTLDFTDKVAITRLLDMSDDSKISIMGSRIILLHLQHPPATIPSLIPLKVKSTCDKLFVFTQSDIRSFDFTTGQLLKIDCHYSSSDSEITCSTVMSHGEVVTGNEKGEVNFYCRDSDRTMQVASWHVGAVQYLQEDSINHLLLSFSDHSGFVLARRNKTGRNWQQLKTMKGNFISRQIVAIQLSAYHSLLAFVSNKSVYLVDYEMFKLSLQILLETEDPTTVTFINGLGLILVGTSLGKIYVFQIQRQTIRQLLIIQCKSNPITHLLTDLSCKQTACNLQVDSCPISCSFQDGTIQVIQFTEQVKSVAFKNSKVSSTAYNPYRQTRQNFQTQIKKAKFQTIEINRQGRRFLGQIVELAGHLGGVNSLSIAEFDEHLLISTGNDSKVKIWKHNKLIGDLSINLPLPYLWDLKIKNSKKATMRLLHGLELIQIIFKRFGKDISIGQSQMFKLTTVQQQQQKYLQRESSTGLGKRLQNKKVVLFQNQFSLVDLNYDKIKRDRLVPVSNVAGPTLKLMQLNRRVETLQKQYHYAKQKEQEDKNTLMTSLQLKAQKNQQKQTITALLRDKNSILALQMASQMTPALQNLDHKLQESLNKQTTDIHTQTGLTGKSLKDSGFRFTGSRNKAQRLSNCKKTLQNYFIQKYSSTEGVLVTQSQKCSPPRSIDTPRQSSAYKKQNAFRIMLKQMKDRLNKSKKDNFIIGKTEIRSRTVKNWKQIDIQCKNINKHLLPPAYCHVEGVDQVIQ